MRHRIRRSRLLVLVLVPILLAMAYRAPASAQDQEVWRPAAAWLGLLDNRNFAESWNQAARVFRARITAEAWARQAAALKDRSGDPTYRELMHIEDVTDPTGVPAGEYIRLHFECRCTRAGVIQEYLLMVDEGARGWRVASYRVETTRS